MPTITSIHNGIAENDIYMGENQCAYAENLHIRNPDGVTLAQKPELLFNTRKNLILGRHGSIYVGEGGTIVDKNGNPTLNTTNKSSVVGTEALYDIHDLGWMKWAFGGDSIYIHTNTTQGGVKRERVGFLGPHNGFYNDGNYYLFGAHSSIGKSYQGDFDFTNGNTSTPLGQKVLGGHGKPLLLKYTGSSVVRVGDTGRISRRDAHSTRMNTQYDNEIEFWQAFYANGTIFIIPGDSEKNTGFGYIQGDVFKQIAHQSETDGHKKYNLGRKQRFGKNIKASIADKIYIPSIDKVSSRGKDFAILSDGYNVDVTHASNGVKIKEIGLMSTTSDPGYIQYAWRDINGDCGVDKLRTGTPTEYQKDGFFYSQKYQLGTDKLRTIGGIKMRADAPNATKVDIYVSIDGGEFSLHSTHQGMTSDVFQTFGKNIECREVQWKFALHTESKTVTPTFKAFSFDLVK